MSRLGEWAMDLDLTKHEEKIMGEIYAPDYLRKHNDKQLHPIADMIENHLTKRIELEAKLAKATEALKTLEVAVNDKIDDPGATAFIRKTLAEIEGEK